MKPRTKRGLLWLLAPALAGGMVGAARGGGSETDDVAPRYDVARRQIIVDGRTNDWRGVSENVVAGEGHLWFGQGMTREKWHDNDDLSYRWRAAWSDGKLYFLFEVDDDEVVEARQEASYLCDCVEIYLDYGNRGGKRVKIMDGRDDWFAKCDRRELMGYELHFLPTVPPSVYLDHTHQYATDKPQTNEFTDRWKGEAVTAKAPTGYLVELGFSVPDIVLESGKVLGVETGVCDDDGQGRESIMMWTGTKGEFWVTMDEYGKLTLRSTTGKAEGPYVDVHPDGPLTERIDASLFEDDDGSVYFVWQNGLIARVKDDLTGLAEQPRLIKPAKGKHVGFEGAFLFKADGRYYLSCAEFNKRGPQGQRCYDCMVATAGNLSGPWSEAYLAIPHGGHNVFFQDKQGHWWTTFFGRDPIAPFRERPAILRIKMDDERRIRPRTDSQSVRKDSLR